jgi:bifunctional DNase/RNase
MIRVKVKDVGPPFPLKPVPVLLLADEQDETMLMLTIGMAEAQAIKSQLSDDEEPPLRPMTHDLLRSVFEHFHAQIDYVVITELRDESFYIAEIHVKSGGRRVVIDSRPSDAIALALRADAPIYVNEEVMRVAGKPIPRARSSDYKEADFETDQSELDQMDLDVAPVETPTAGGDSPLDIARKKLQAAIDEERYEEAARLRDEIKKLEQNAQP